MNGFDATIILFLNQFAARSWTFDHCVAFVATHSFVKAGVIVSMLWWAWFCDHNGQSERRKHVVALVFLTVGALFVARVLALTLPFRLRPLQSPHLAFHPPYDITADPVTGWSSFPSDHAVMFFALATGLWFISRGIGSLALLYSALVISLPRVYIGFHYPSDIIAGALLGGLIGSLVRFESVRNLVACFALAWERRHRAAFYVCYFVITYEMANLFDDVREFATLAFEVISAHVL